MGARLLSRVYSYNKEDELINLAKKAVDYCCNFQNPDGSWYYSTLPFHQWIDNFHTGFNLECIYEYGKFSNDDSFKKNFDKGLNYYLQTFFDTQGRSKYYNNSLYPIDIHAPSQLIVTLSKSNQFNEYKELIDRVVTWTIFHMQSRKGYFYFQKRKFTSFLIDKNCNQPSKVQVVQWIRFGLTSLLAGVRPPTAFQIFLPFFNRFFCNTSVRLMVRRTQPKTFVGTKS